MRYQNIIRVSCVPMATSPAGMSNCEGSERELASRSSHGEAGGQAAWMATRTYARPAAAVRPSIQSPDGRTSRQAHCCTVSPGCVHGLAFLRPT